MKFMDSSTSIPIFSLIQHLLARNFGGCRCIFSTLILPARSFPSQLAAQLHPSVQYLSNLLLKYICPTGWFLGGTPRHQCEPSIPQYMVSIRNNIVLYNLCYSVSRWVSYTRIRIFKWSYPHAWVKHGYIKKKKGRICIA